jgi:hypothetical protein
MIAQGSQQVSMPRSVCRPAKLKHLELPAAGECEGVIEPTAALWAVCAAAVGSCVYCVGC